ncbi:hypothetical protein HaLaN_00387 [Haematococcus lacustris]|uniref:Uncharacterized protein n=1 Tax=Haematococcus lacustris TaxID=44745 RepID=A0A699YFP4_HAELA|nr:hypothetical protein HaLaN_00387 [Haematococcus lacustris]
MVAGLLQLLAGLLGGTQFVALRLLVALHCLTQQADLADLGWLEASYPTHAFVGIRSAVAAAPQQWRAALVRDDLSRPAAVASAIARHRMQAIVQQTAAASAVASNAAAAPSAQTPSNSSSSEREGEQQPGAESDPSRPKQATVGPSLVQLATAAGAALHSLANISAPAGPSAAPNPYHNSLNPWASPQQSAAAAPIRAIGLGGSQAAVAWRQLLSSDALQPSLPSAADRDLQLTSLGVLLALASLSQSLVAGASAALAPSAHSAAASSGQQLGSPWGRWDMLHALHLARLVVADPDNKAGRQSGSRSMGQGDGLAPPSQAELLARLQELLLADVFLPACSAPHLMPHVVTAVCSLVASNPRELHLPRDQPKPADWVPQAGQVIQRLAPSAWSQRHGKHLCRWEGLEDLPVIGKENQQGFNLVSYRLPKT